eukprot:1160132-Pelagomonas_calceolata.AAC.1
MLSNVRHVMHKCASTFIKAGGNSPQDFHRGLHNERILAGTTKTLEGQTLRRKEPAAVTVHDPKS